MNSALRLVNSLLLIAILSTLLLIWRRMPPTIGEVKAAEGDAKSALLLRRPYVRAAILDAVSIDTTTEPLEVRIVE